MITLDMPLCMRCSSADTIAHDPIELDGRKLIPHACNACSYTWYMDIDPPVMRKVDLHVSEEIRLRQENDALREIIASQAAVIGNYQDMLGDR